MDRRVKVIGRLVAQVLANDLGRDVVDVLASVENHIAPNRPSHAVEEAELMADPRGLGHRIEDARYRRQAGKVDDPQGAGGTKGRDRQPFSSRTAGAESLDDRSIRILG